MDKTVADLRDSVSGILSSVNLDDVTDVNGCFERAARILAQKADVPEATGVENITLYDGVFDYTAPTTIFGSALVDFRPQGDDRSINDYVYRNGKEVFDRTKQSLTNGYTVAFETRNNTGVMRVSQAKTFPRATLDTMQAADWTAGGSASTPVVDQTVYFNAPYSLRFTLTGASTGYIEKAITSSNLSDYQGVGVVFLALRIPDANTATNLTNIQLRLGSSATAYVAVNATSGFLGAWTVGDFILIALDLAQTTTTGSPDFTAVDYCRLTFTHGATMTNIRVGGLWVALPSPHKVLFQTAAIFLPENSSSPLRTITETTDTILLNDAAYTLYQHECAQAILLQGGGTLASPMYQMINEILHGVRARNGAVIQAGLYDLYRADNPSEEIREIGNYYLD